MMVCTERVCVFVYVCFVDVWDIFLIHSLRVPPTELSQGNLNEARSEAHCGIICNLPYQQTGAERNYHTVCL